MTTVETTEQLEQSLVEQPSQQLIPSTVPTPSANSKDGENKPIADAYNRFIADYTDKIKQLKDYDGTPVNKLKNAMMDAKNRADELYSNDSLRKAASSDIVETFTKIQTAMDDACASIGSIGKQTNEITLQTEALSTVTARQMKGIESLKSDIQNGFMRWLADSFCSICKVKEDNIGDASTTNISKWAKHIDSQIELVKKTKNSEIQLLITATVKSIRDGNGMPPLESLKKNKNQTQLFTDAVAFIKKIIEDDKAKPLTSWSAFYESKNDKKLTEAFEDLKKAYNITGEILGGNTHHCDGGCCGSISPKTGKVVGIILGIVLVVLVLIVVIVYSRPPVLPPVPPAVFSWTY